MSRIFITGSSQGIGAECARQLLDLGHEVILHARDDDRASAALAANPGATAVLTGDLASIEQTTALAAAANEQGPYDAIIHNAGLGGDAPERVTTADGIERIYQVNVVAPYLLTALMPVAKRMIYLTSGLEANGHWHPYDLQGSTREWNGMQAYSDSKLQLSMLAIEIAALNPDSAVNVVDPGWIRTRMGGAEAWDPVELGAETQVWLADSDEPDATTTGRYLKRREQLEPNPTVRDAEARDALVYELIKVTGVVLP
ncbi:SDR family NAD(P)-dependent oxidoreductase [Demequina muriae]|uniref:SDR family NAD(P)-dependent oxidoreductase n=1 Tax=Demequina muriae TaxID=3051664 RepID=A0ABT8GFV7_9MICO|nr:SDR family NAD(P)-dependent oxidoreductase [Demequina sp. EGI L300058]MDN4480305.1 SDR family NAD(P)-dependent oxidoreductase [Demequina sp. EGI L300058]